MSLHSLIANMLSNFGGEHGELPSPRLFKSRTSPRTGGMAVPTTTSVIPRIPSVISEQVYFWRQDIRRGLHVFSNRERPFGLNGLVRLGVFGSQDSLPGQGAAGAVRRTDMTRRAMQPSDSPGCSPNFPCPSH